MRKSIGGVAAKRALRTDKTPISGPAPKPVAPGLTGAGVPTRRLKIGGVSKRALR